MYETTSNVEAFEKSSLAQGSAAIHDVESPRGGGSGSLHHLNMWCKCNTAANGVTYRYCLSVFLGSISIYRSRNPTYY